jgi:hypothetical protein
MCLLKWPGTAMRRLITELTTTLTHPIQLVTFKHVDVL